MLIQYRVQKEHNYLVNTVDVDEGGLKVHVGELSDWILSVTGGLLLGFILNNSVSLIVASESGDRTTEPGVILGSSSIDFSWLP